MHKLRRNLILRATGRPGSFSGATVAVAAAALLVSCGLAGGRTPQHLLLVTLDTTRADALGCYGNATARTPVLDRLAAEGIRFERCATCTPLTLPAHCTIMTGAWPFTHGVRRNGFERLAPEQVTLAEILREEGFSTGAVVASAVLRGSFGLNQGFETYRDVETRGPAGPGLAERKGDAVVAEATALLRRMMEGGDKRIFLWVHFYDPHYPYESERHPDPLSPEAYADEVAYVDTQVGRLLDELERMKLRDRTLVAVVGDHGEGLMEHGESEHGYFVYESTMRVPFLLHGPGSGPAGRVVSALTRTIDIAPTLLQSLGLPPAQPMRGRSLRPLLEGREAEPGLAAYGETHSSHEVFGLSVLRSLTQGSWKYIHADPPELYNLEADPREAHDLSGGEAGRVEEMRGLLARLLQGAARTETSGGAASVSREDEELFRSLGYVGGDAETGTAGAITREEFAPRGANPAPFAEAIEAYARSHRHTARREWAQSEQILRRVVETLPEAPHPRRDLALALRQQGREGEMLDFCRELLRRRPEATDLRLYVARRLNESGRREEAAREIEEAARLAPDHPGANVDVAGLLIARGALDEARRRLELSLARDPESVRALQGLAVIAERRDSLAAAAAYLRRAMEIEPQAATLRRELDRITRLATAPR